MSFTALQIIQTVSRTLIDVDHVRWSLAELLDHINDAVRTIVSAKPNAKTETVTLDLDPGTLQTLPDKYTVLSRITRNMTIGHTEPGGPVGASAIRMVAGRDLMDSFFPNWQSDTALFSSIVQHAICDDADLRHFYVIPGNTGAGKIEAVVGVMPDTLAVMGVETDEANYSVLVPLPDKYRTAVTDYVSFRAFSKDQGVPASEARAVKHLNAFQITVQAIGAAEGDASAARAPSGGT